MNTAGTTATAQAAGEARLTGQGGRAVEHPGRGARLWAQRPGYQVASVSYSTT